MHQFVFQKYRENWLTEINNIEETISIGDYSLYIDYSENVYLELNSAIEDSTQSFW